MQSTLHKQMLAPKQASKIRVQARFFHRLALAALVERLAKVDSPGRQIPPISFTGATVRVAFLRNHQRDWAMDREKMRQRRRWKRPNRNVIDRNAAIADRAAT